VSHADGEIGEAVTVEVAHGEGGPVTIAVLARPFHARLVLVPNLVVGGSQTSWSPIQDVDGAGIYGVTDVLAGDPDGEVAEAVEVEVTGHESLPEAIALLGRTLYARRVLRPDLVVRRAQTRGAAVEDVDGAGIDDGAHVLTRDTDHQVAKAISIVIARCAHGGPKFVRCEMRP
jgi:hypothetical protein